MTHLVEVSRCAACMILPTGTPHRTFLEQTGAAGVAARHVSCFVPTDPVSPMLVGINSWGFPDAAPMCQDELRDRNVRGSMPQQPITPYSVEERILDGGTAWVAIRARGAEWSWLTPAEAAHLGQQLVDRYGPRDSQTTATQ